MKMNHNSILNLNTVPNNRMEKRMVKKVTLLVILNMVMKKKTLMILTDLVVTTKNLRIHSSIFRTMLDKHRQQSKV